VYFYRILLVHEKTSQKAKYLKAYPSVLYHKKRKISILFSKKVIKNFIFSLFMHKRQKNGNSERTFYIRLNCRFIWFIYAAFLALIFFSMN